MPELTTAPTPLIHANGAAIPVIGLGTWAARGEECARAVAAALHAGYRHIDTASMYGNEEAVGEGLRAGGVKRDHVFVTTKVWYEDLRQGALQRSAEGSLKRLGIGEMDLLLIHWPNAAIPLKESIAALCEAKARGLARHIGVANFTVALLDEAMRLASESLVANQCEYHPRLDQSAILAACRAYGLAFTAYSPLGRGDLLREPAIVAIAQRHGRSAAQIVLRWQVQQPGVAAIPKSSHPERIAENLAVFDFELAAAEMDAIFALARPDGRLIDPGWAPRWDGSR